MLPGGSWGWVSRQFRVARPRVRDTVALRAPMGLEIMCNLIGVVN